MSLLYWVRELDYFLYQLNMEFFVSILPCKNHLYMKDQKGVNLLQTDYRLFQGGLNKAGKVQAYAKGSHHTLAVLVGLFSAITGGISFCLIRAGARETDQPMYNFLHELAYAID